MRTRTHSAFVFESVLRVLTRHPHGLTLRELSRKSGVPLTTLRFYLDRNLGHFVYDDRIELIPIRPIQEMRGFLKGIDSTVPREADRV